MSTVETAVPAARAREAVRLACCETLKQLTDGLLSAAWRSSDPGEADAERYRLRWRGHAASMVALALQTQDPEEATRFALGHLRQQFVGVFDLLYGSRRAPAVPNPDGE